MLAYYSEIDGRENVPAETPLEIDVGSVPELFKRMNSGRGFLGLRISGRLRLQLIKRRKSVTLELLDVSRSIEYVDVSFQEMEGLLEQFDQEIHLEDLVRQSFAGWQRIDLEKTDAGRDVSKESSGLYADSVEGEVQFIATEAGVRDGIAGASNSKSGDPYHYVLFGSQSEPLPGVYFESDSQKSGGVNIVREVFIGTEEIVFFLKEGLKVRVRSRANCVDWDMFIDAARECFPLHGGG
jgi:hypothetical protein